MRANPHIRSYVCVMALMLELASRMILGSESICQDQDPACADYLRLGDSCDYMKTMPYMKHRCNMTCGRCGTPIIEAGTAARRNTHEAMAPPPPDGTVVRLLWKFSIPENEEVNPDEPPDVPVPPEMVGLHQANGTMELVAEQWHDKTVVLHRSATVNADAPRESKERPECGTRDILGCDIRKSLGEYRVRARIQNRCNQTNGGRAAEWGDWVTLGARNPDGEVQFSSAHNRFDESAAVECAFP